jgi:hypothetical protein
MDGSITSIGRLNSHAGFLYIPGNKFDESGLGPTVFAKAKTVASLLLLPAAKDKLSNKRKGNKTLRESILIRADCYLCLQRD